MKNLVVLIMLFLLIGCKKESQDKIRALKLSAVVVNGKINERYEYNHNNLLERTQYFGVCETNPSDEYFYIYKNQKLDTLKSVLRSFYSSTAAMCDPASGLSSYTSFSYDNRGRIDKVTGVNSIRTLFYNDAGLVEKQVISNGSASSLVNNYRYDSKGNLIEETDYQGYRTQYEFDNKINPYFLIKHHPDIITAFMASPNNVIKIIKQNNIYEIKYQYNSSGLPVKMFDSNGIIYEYEYE